MGRAARALEVTEEILMQAPEPPDAKPEFAAGVEPYVWARHTRNECLTVMGRLGGG